MSRDTTQRVKDMLDSRHQINPQAMLKVDIDPPFVGADFNMAGSDPSLFELNNTLYLAFVDTSTGQIKVAVLTQGSLEKWTVTSIYRTITAPGAKRPRLCFEPSTVSGRPDLPHVAYTNSVTGKAMVYRELYDAEGHIQVINDEIGAGESCGAVRMGDKVIDFYIGTDGVFYSRLQGEFAAAMISPVVGGAIVKTDTLSLPDGRFAVCYIERDADGYVTRKVAYSELFGQRIFDGESLEMMFLVQSIQMPQTTFWNDEAMELLFTVVGVELAASIYIFNDKVELQFNVNGILLQEPVYSQDKIELAFSTVAIILAAPIYISEKIELTFSVRGIELAS